MSTIDLSFTHYIGPLLVMIIAFILVYIFLKQLKIPASDPVLAILSLVMALVFATSVRSISYLINLIPLMTVVATTLFLILIMLAFFLTKDLEPFKKPLGWIGFILIILIALALAFDKFPTLNHMLPHSSDSGLGSNLSEFKDFIYGKTFRDTLIFVIAVGVVTFFLVQKAKK